MASKGPRTSKATNTRLQRENEKRKTKEQLKTNAELKRQKKMFARQNIIGPRDILVSSNSIKLQLEDDAVYRSAVVKEESLEVESSSEKSASQNNEQTSFRDNEDLKMDIEYKVFRSQFDATESEIFNEQDEQSEQSDNIICKVNVDHDGLKKIGDIEHGDKKHSLDSQERKFFARHIKALEALVRKKEKEINRLIRIIRSLQSRLTKMGVKDVTNEHQMQHVDEDHFNPRNDAEVYVSLMDNQTVIAQCASKLASRNIRIEMLTVKMIKLQNELFVKMTEDLQTVKGNEDSQKTQLNNFDNESFKISNWPKFTVFTKIRNNNKIGSSVCLDNLPPATRTKHVIAVKRFSATFGVHIKNLEIRHFVPLQVLHYHKIIHINKQTLLWAKNLQNLSSITIVFSFGEKKLYNPDIETTSENMKVKTFSVTKFTPLQLKFLEHLSQSWGLDSTQSPKKQLRELRSLAIGKVITHIFVYQQLNKDGSCD